MLGLALVYSILIDANFCKGLHPSAPARSYLAANIRNGRQRMVSKYRFRLANSHMAPRGEFLRIWVCLVVTVQWTGSCVERMFEAWTTSPQRFKVSLQKP